MIRNLKPLLWVVITLPFFASCLSYKSIPYFRDLSQSNNVDSITNPYSSPLVQKNDILSITVGSISQEANLLFGFNATNGTGQYSTGSTYMVDKDGKISIPLIGSVVVEGKTTMEIRDMVSSRLEAYLKEPVVEVRIANFRVAVIGAVGNPGLLISQNERLTVLDALSMSGDLNIDAHRENVLLIREEAGIRKQIRFNLNNSDFMSSPYFYLRSNDVLYVQPGKFAVRDMNYRNLSYVFAFISILALFQSFLK